MILIADGGSTKVDWCLADQGKMVKRMATLGANPFFRTESDMAGEWRDCLLPALVGYPVEAVRFYGAGCATDEKSEVVRRALASCFDCPDVRVASDLLGAAIGLCGHRAGIACILGTGSNSCFYDGERITENVPSLGYVLGDEGSGAVLGRLFIGACLKGQLTPGLREEMLAVFQAMRTQAARVTGETYAAAAKSCDGLGFSLEQFAFALAVFEELGLVSLKGGRLNIVRGKKTELSASPLYCAVEKLKEE